MTTFTVTDMTCGHCVKSITQAIHEVAPEALVLCDVNTKQVRVGGDFEPKVVAAAIVSAGFHLQN